MNKKNIMIPHSLLNRVIDLLECWDVSHCDDLLRCYYNSTLSILNHKKQRLDLRNAYAEIINSDNPDDRDDARINYLQKKASMVPLDVQCP